MLNIIQENKQRFTTGVVLVLAVLFLGAIANYFIIWLFLGIVYLFAFKESMELLDLDNEKLYFYAIGLWFLALFIQDHPQGIGILALVAMGSIIAYNPKQDTKETLVFIYPTIPMFFMLGLFANFGVSALFWLLLVVAGTDIGAYFFGKNMGKTPFSPTSPNKTLEGVYGGIVIGTLLGTIIGLNFGSFFLAFFISVTTALSSIFGDLFESYLKRNANVKDSGDIFPGHGGMLDRVDGYLFGSIVMLVLLLGFS